MPHTIRLMACAVLILMVSVTTVGAQATAQINGTVADSSGGVLPGAAVTAMQTDTGFRREVVTDQTGFLHAARTCQPDRIVSKWRSPASAPTCRQASCCRSTAIR